MKKEDFELNPDSDRYRECLNCKAPFMATHRSRKFCDNYHWCHDEYNNGLKRKKKQEDKNETTTARLINQERTPTLLELNIANISKLGPTSSGLDIPIEQLSNYGINPNNYENRMKTDSIDGIDRYILKFGPYTMTFEKANIVTFYHTEVFNK